MSCSVKDTPNDIKKDIHTLREKKKKQAIFSKGRVSFLAVGPQGTAIQLATEPQGFK